jgi:hypothetical protein
MTRNACGRRIPICLYRKSNPDNDTDTIAARDEVVVLPGCGRVQSLNVAGAAALLIYSLTRS